ncbi:hypothetical protein NDU88_001630 [Pleurodeles waltl]|uniref:Uncharacterized protein n=1 Tax=Pleurodeles waltl TaxID=8319 RepID=A0AAV7V8W1_PLEWA|nr:hypothetical protein NDU88_001630 [Pleurodeles waltl]
MGAVPDAWDSDFRVPGTVKRDDGLKEGMEESSGATASKGEDRLLEDTAPSAEEDEIGKPELPKARTRLEERTRPQETSAFRHVPGGTWLNKPKDGHAVAELCRLPKDPAQYFGLPGEASEAQTAGEKIRPLEGSGGAWCEHRAAKKLRERGPGPDDRGLETVWRRLRQLEDGVLWSA